MKLDPNIMRASYIAKNAPSDHEIGWLGHKRFKGSKEKVQIKFDPNDDKIKDQFIYHTHPYRGDSNPLYAMPSAQDLKVASRISQQGLKGIVIFAGRFYTVIVPTDKADPESKMFRYDKALKRGDIEDAIKAIEQLGYDIETGEL